MREAAWTPSVALTLFALQGLAMTWDEFYFHRKRGLPRWERFGHPMDTVSVLGCFLLCTLTDPDPAHLRWFIGAALFSCIFITKDEWLHSKLCTPAESWVHAVLFILHPLVLLSAAWVWQLNTSRTLLRIETGIISIYLVYQILYWNFLWKAPENTTA